MRKIHLTILFLIYALTSCNSSLIGTRKKSSCAQNQLSQQKPKPPQPQDPSFALTQTTAQSTVLTNGTITIAITTAEALAVAGTVNSNNIATGSFSASNSNAAAVADNGTLVSAAGTSTQVDGAFNINLNNFRGKFLFSLTQSYAVVSQNAAVAQKCSTFTAAYTIKNDQAVFGQLQTAKNLNCPADNSLRLIGKIIQLIKITKIGNNLQLESGQEKITLKLKQRRQNRQKEQKNDMEGIYAIQYPSQTAEFKDNKIYFEGCNDHPISYTCNNEGDITTYQYPEGPKPECLRNKETMLERLRKSSKVVGRQDRRSFRFRDGRGHNLLSCRQK